MKNLLDSINNNEKAKYFDQIAKEYFNGNFGSFSKSQMDLLMFHILCEIYRLQGKDITDYELSNQLGIVESRVRTYRTKEYLQFREDDFNWEEEFLKAACKPYRVGDMIKISIEDPIVQRELKHYLEVNGGLYDNNLNCKLLSITPLTYVELIIQIQSKFSGTDDNQLEKEFYKALNADFRKNKKIEDKITKESFKDCCKKAAPEVLEILVKVLLDTSGLNLINLTIDSVKAVMKLFV